MNAGPEINVLLVDDKPANLAALEAVLGDLGLNLVKAESAAEALRALMAREFAVILTDVSMPVMGGVNLVAMIRRREQTRTTPIIFVTASDPEAASVLRGYAAGAVDYLVKPIAAEVLRSKVRAFAELYRQSVALREANSRLRDEVARRLATETALQQALLGIEDQVRERTADLARESARVRELLTQVESDRRALLESMEEQRRGQEALRESEQRLRRTLMEAPFPIIVHAEDGEVILVNHVWTELTGYVLAEIPTVADWTHLAYGERKEAVRTDIDRLYRMARRFHEGEYVITTRTGQKRTWDFSSAPLGRLPDGRRAVVSVAADITDRKQAEDELRRSEKKFSILFDKAGFPATLSRLPDGLIVEANEAFEKALGHTRDEVVGKTTLELGIFPAAEQRQTAISEVQAHGCIRGMEFTLYAKSGEPRTMLANADLVEIGGDQYVLTTAHDITERRRAEAALRESEMQLRLFVEHSPAAVAMLDRNMRYLVASRRWLADYRVGNRDIIGRSHYEIFPDIPERWKEVHRRCLAGAVERCEEDPFPRADGTTDWIRWEIRPWHHADGEVGGIIIMSEVITERKRMEEARDRLQAALNRSERMAEIGSLVAGVAHEVRNPLFGMSATLDAFEARFGGQAEHRQYLAVVRGELDRLKVLMKDLLDYGKLPESALTPEPIGPVIAEAVRACTPMAREAQVQIAAGGTAPAVPVAMDRDRLRRVFENMLRNAVQMSSAGGTVRVDVAAMRDNGSAWIECAVSDTGPGFRQEDLARAFEPFFSRRRGGTGLGLSIVQRIVEEHGGTVTAGNRPEGGAVVTVRLPAAA